MKKSLILTPLKGTALSCGKAYGEAFSQRILEFLNLEVKPTSKRLSYARSCLKEIEKYAPRAMAFMKGMSKGSGLDLEKITLLALHEEICHQKHCTALLARGSAAKNKQTIIGQNWDWPPSLSSWPGLLELSINRRPKIISYHYPGLWTSLGVNEAGLAIMWTGGGYWPQIKPAVGVPTYVIISELLGFKKVNSAVNYLEKIKHAGCFLFFLADADGTGAVIEAIPGKLAVEQGAEIYTRANHYECGEIIRASKQRLPPKKISDTKVRAKYINKLMEKNYGKISKRIAQKILLDKNGIYGYEEDSITVDSFVAVCEERTLSVKRGGSDSNRWKTYSL